LNTNNETALGTMPVGKLLFQLAVPTIAAQVINALYNMVDRIYIGRLPGGEGPLAIAGLGIAFPIIMIISAFASMIGMGGSPRVSIKMGQQDHDGAEKILGNAVTALIALAVPLTLFFYLAKEPLLSMFGATDNILPYANDYLGIYLLGSIFVMFSLGLNSFITCQGFARTSMLTVLIGALLNIVLDPIFIFIMGLGVKGSALATVISQGVSAAWVLRFLTGKKTDLKIRRKNLRLEAKVLLPVIALGIAPFIMQSTESLVQITLNSGMKRYGGASADSLVSVTTIAISAMQFLSMPALGLAQGAQPIISFNYGSRNMDRVKKAFRLLFVITVAYTLGIWALSMAVPQIYIYLFSSGEAARQLSVLGRPMIRIFMGGFLFIGAQYACQNTFMALGRAKISLVMALLRKIILLIPLALFLPLFFGTTGIFAAEPIADILASAVTTGVFYFTSKKLLVYAPDDSEQGNPAEEEMKA